MTTPPVMPTVLRRRQLVRDHRPARPSPTLRRTRQPTHRPAPLPTSSVLCGSTRCTRPVPTGPHPEGQRVKRRTRFANVTR
ncbi:hypothetical protein Ae706Ps2_4998c [Pseudonocardia sp. Ae706_Ps2]|nr:hypothetical protein Ae706Ps2_4998c [Pseudonocardia sp. Ae706_Ps2]